MVPKESLHQRCHEHQDVQKQMAMINDFGMSGSMQMGSNLDCEPKSKLLQLKSQIINVCMFVIGDLTMLYNSEQQKSHP